ncbi:leucyl-tRNA synthetase [Melanomma pulvis-pyrius CBS 109.77]|uniref:leucine--tRNA ligase n=1 Tax=Melanomma pulvis-pyrius CBS 109.77 TaxID=1314802 RepID=A0A6A6WQC5_9PLEO|nr:leucyl-tRNA synthetase [Melanomma pulvis-pyrius CBS 109.77]
MFPYPSGTLHLGHLRVYTISDVLARFKHMQGYHVLHPIGWDAFGLPAENAAIERGVHPEKWTLHNIQAMKAQMMAMGGQWDWDRELRTCDPDFYQHTQRIFLMLHERGLAYQAESMVNYDPVDKTVLANEQVDAKGCSWRSGAKVQKIMLKQWFLKIKEFQEPLLKDLDALAENGSWPERVLAMQRNWLGRSEGTELCFDIQTEHPEAKVKPVEVFTTRADTLFGVQYIALSLNHPIVQEIAKQDEALGAFLQRAPDFPPDSREGYLLPNVTARNPVSTILNGNGVSEPLPVYVAPYVLDDYGSGAVMGVPGHDTRDHAFWRANAPNSTIKVVITAKANHTPRPLIAGAKNDKPMVRKGFVAANINGFAGLPSDQAVEEIVTRLQQSGQPIEKTENWRLRDWLISRQRYWGTPIPIIHCNSCGPVPVPDDDLPVELPNLPDRYFQGKTGNPLAEDVKWKKTLCPKCGSSAERETDTMDTFMDSSWYFFKFLTPKDKSPFGSAEVDHGMPVDLYVGGVEHAILHLLYARFISKFLSTTPLWQQGRLVQGEPFKKLITQGMVHGKTYSDPDTGRFLNPAEVDKTNPSAPVIISSGLAPKVSFEKMSKSKYNGVDPGKTIALYGADVTRAHMLFQAPVSDILEWDETSITGVQRWLARVLEISNAPFFPPHLPKTFKPPNDLDQPLIHILASLRHSGALKPATPTHGKPSPFETAEEELISCLKLPEQKLWLKTQETIASVHKSYSETYSLNTIVSDLMSLTNTIEAAPHSSAVTPHLAWHATAHLLRMLAPIAPAVAEEGWETLHKRTSGPIAENPKHHPLLRHNGGPSIFAWGFPSADPDSIRLLDTTMTCVFQVDGKRKFEVEIWKKPPSVTGETETRRWVLDQVAETERGREWLERGEGKLWKISGVADPHPDYIHVPESWQVVAASGGRILNVVSPRGKAGKAGGLP